MGPTRVQKIPTCRDEQMTDALRNRSTLLSVKRCKVKSILRDRQTFSPFFEEKNFAAASQPGEKGVYNLTSKKRKFKNPPPLHSLAKRFLRNYYSDIIFKNLRRRFTAWRKESTIEKLFTNLIVKL
jgi:hypothetical protein